MASGGVNYELHTLNVFRIPSEQKKVLVFTLGNRKDISTHETVRQDIRFAKRYNSIE